MNKLMLSIIALMALAGGALLAQNVTGSWQGTLQPAAGRQLRIVVKIALEDDKLKAVLYSIDQPGPGIPASTLARDGSTVKMTIAAMNGTYEGKLSADGNSMAGAWTQGGSPLPLNLTRATPETAWAIPEPPPPPVRMAADAKPGFEVATIKPSDPARPGRVFTIRGQEVITINTTVSDLISTAYQLHPRQIAGGPAWLESEKYDVTGKPDVPGQPNVVQLKIMLQKLLADRFQLKFHLEKRELGVYAITVAKTGVKFAKSERDPQSLPGLFFGGPGTRFNVTNATMEEVAGVLQGTVLDKPVVDQTGLREKYDFILKFTPDQSQMLGFGRPPTPAAEDPDAPPDLFTAMQQQLGLRLQSTKAPVDVLLIDHVEKPSAN